MISSSTVITILADNRALPPYKAEHGFSCLLEVSPAEGKPFSVLFDTGRTVLFENARNLTTEALDSVTHLVLSHGHYDHTDALPDILDRIPGIVVCASRKIKKRHYSISTGAVRDRSLSAATRSTLSRLKPENQLYFDDRLSLNSCIELVGNIPRTDPEEQPAPLLYADKKCTTADTVPDEIALWFETKNGLVIVSGCCHAGFINTCEYIKKESGIGIIFAVIGGFHLENCAPERLIRLCAYIREQHIQKLVPCHCTGHAEMQYLESALGQNLVNLGYAGQIITF